MLMMRKHRLLSSQKGPISPLSRRRQFVVAAISERDQMSQIDREMEQVERGPRSVTLFSTVGALATPFHGALAPRRSREPWLAQTFRGLKAAIEHAVDAI